MALRLNTVECAFPQLIATCASGGVQNFSQILVEIPETTNRVFTDAFADIFFLDNVATATNMTAWSLGIRCGSENNFENQTISQSLTNTGENMSFHCLFDLSTLFKTYFTGTIHAIDASFSVNTTAINNLSCKLVFTYQWDDTDQTRIKTVRIPIESSTGRLGDTLKNIRGEGMNNVPALDLLLPEASKAYKDIFFETWVNENTVAARTINPSLGFALDSETVDWDYGHEDALNSARLYRRIWQRKDMDTTKEHEFKASATYAAAMGFQMLGSLLNVTYTYYEPDTTQVMNSIILAAADEFGIPGSTTDTYKSRFKRDLSIQENNPILKTSGILFSYNDAGLVTLDVAVGSQNYTRYVIAAAQNCGGYMFYHNIDASSRKGAGLSLSRNGNFTVDWYSTSKTPGQQGTNFSGLMYLNYISDKSSLPGGSANHNHTVISFFKALSVENTLFEITKPALIIPEQNYWLTSVVPVISSNGRGSILDWISLSANLDASTYLASGWVDLYTGAVKTDAERGPTISFGRARKEFKRWKSDLDEERMDITKSRIFRLLRGTESYFGCYFPITYHTITNYVSGKVVGYVGNGDGISIYAYDREFMKEYVYEGSTGIGGQYGFVWYNSSTNLYIEAYQDAEHTGYTKGGCDTSLNINFGTMSSSATSWVF